MSLQSLQRQLNAITQKLEAIHSDIHQAPLAARSKGQALPNSGTGSPRVGRSLTSFVDNDAPTRPVGRMNSNNGEEILIPQPPPKGPRDCTSPETTRPGRGASAVLIKDAFPEPIPRDPNNVSPGASLGVVVLEESIGRGSRLDSSVNSTSTENAPRQSPQSGSLEKGDKKKSAILKQARDQFFAKYEFRGKWNEIPKAQGVSCVWLACAAIAVEFVTGVATTMEMFMVTNHLAVHYVSFPSVTLAELYDTVDEYLIASGHTSQGNRCEIATFDRITIDDVGDEMGMGERLPVMTLAAFRKELSRLESHSILIFNYDPFVVQEAEMVLQELEDEEEEGSIKEKKVDTPEQWAAKNQGNFALMLQFNSALHTVTIGTPQLGPDGVYRMETHTVSLQTMYTACCVKDGYTNKSRGFVRVFRDRSDSRQIPSLFPITLLDGRDAGGLLSSSLDVAIAPHILGLSFLHHLVQATLLNDRARRRQSTKSVSDVQLRGIPVTKVCHVLGLPVGAVVGGSSKDSIACAFAWYKIFLAKLGIQNDVHLGIITINRKGGTEDGAVNITDEHFLSDVSLAVSSKSVMLVAFDVNVALNVAVETRGDPCHFAIVVGIDESHGIVKLADVSVKKYRKVWHVPITRLYNATIQYGYIVASASPDVIERLGCSKFVDSILNQARYRLPAYSHFSRFEYPVKNYTITVLADAFDRLGFPNSNVESFVHNAGFHVSFLLSEHIPLEGAVRIASFYSHTVLLDEMRVTAKHYDNREVQTLDGFCQDLREALARNDALLLVNFQTTTIQKVKEVWNGGNGGSLAIVTNFNEADGNVTVCDANFSAYYRTWSVPVGVLYDAITQVDRICGRARGTLLLEKTHQTLYDDTRGYDQRRAMVHHPFKPTISTTAATIALAASEMMQKSYSQEQFLYNTLEFNLCKFTTRAADVDAVVADANHAFRQLNVQLIAVALPCSTPDELQAAINGTEGLLSVTIVLYNTDVMHKTTGLGNGAAVVNNRGEGGIVKLVDGNPTVFGDFWEASLEALHASVLGVLVVRGQGDDMES